MASCSERGPVMAAHRFDDRDLTCYDIQYQTIFIIYDTR
jgi:hypothetical protein